MSQSKIAERDARLMQNLDEATARLLFPERFDEPLQVTLEHPPLQGEAAVHAARIAGEGLRTRADPRHPDAPPRQQASFTLARVQQLHEYYALLEAALPPAEVDVLLSGKPVPMVRELWLPLLWLLRS